MDMKQIVLGAVVILLLALAVMVESYDANGQDGLELQANPMVCVPFTWDKVQRNTERNVGEVLTYQGIDVDGRLLSVLVNEETGTFTIWVLAPGAERPCMISAGKAWRKVLMKGTAL